jgi:hypothetical protein
MEGAKVAKGFFLAWSCRNLVLLPWFVREPPAVASRIDGGGDLSVAVA